MANNKLPDQPTYQPRQIVQLNAGEALRKIFSKIKLNEPIIIETTSGHIELQKSLAYNGWYDFDIVYVRSHDGRMSCRYSICIMPNDEFSQLYTPVFDDDTCSFNHFNFCLGEINKYYKDVYAEHVRASPRFFDGLSAFKADPRFQGLWYQLNPYPGQAIGWSTN